MALAAAILLDDKDLFDLMIENGFSINTTEYESDNYCPVQAAAVQKNSYYLSVLISKGADFELPPEYVNPISFALDESNFNHIKLMLESGILLRQDEITELLQEPRASGLLLDFIKPEQITDDMILKEINEKRPENAKRLIQLMAKNKKSVSTPGKISFTVTVDKDKFGEVCAILKCNTNIKINFG